ncbi:spindle pole body component 97 [Drosophila biarmipes]|uniref:spindle pole body component 97 n=1 Tax=Drosophila biarmipes TaxID=125945 RepID=UPI0021CC565A|nr:spindle pole body component 97 [Drosophila biarmipes]
MWQLLIFLACLLPGHQVRAVFLEECKGVIINKVTNENQECSEFVHCDGDDSYYCNGDCREPVQCYQEELPTEAPAPVTTIKPIVTTTAKPPSEEPSTPVNTTSTTTSTATDPPTTTTPVPSSDDIRVICKTSGRNGVYPYPANSNYYYQCISGYLLLQQCPQNFHFEASQGQCISSKPYRSSGFHL